jgi:hypothetical protein
MADDAPDCTPDGPVNLADDEQPPTEEVGVIGGLSQSPVPPCRARAVFGRFSTRAPRRREPRHRDARLVGDGSHELLDAGPVHVLSPNPRPRRTNKTHV